MLSIESAMYKLLCANSALKELVGDRIYLDASPQEEAYPRLLFAIIFEESTYHLDGVEGLSSFQVQFTVIAKTSSSRRDIANCLRNYYDGKKHFVQEDFAIRYMRRESSVMNSNFDQDDKGSDIFDFTAAITYNVWFVDSIPSHPA